MIRFIHNTIIIFLFQVFKQRFTAVEKLRRELCIRQYPFSFLIGKVTAPPIIPGMIDHSGFYRILKNIPQNRQIILICFNCFTPETVLEQMACPLILPVVPHRIAGTNPFENDIQWFTARFNQKMNMI